MNADSGDAARDARTHAIIGAAMEVHRQLGSGFLEPVYQEALALELAARQVPFVREQELPVHYKGQSLCCKYRTDFLCFSAVIVEVKALAALGGIEQAQVLNYLKATGHEISLLVNFGASSLEFKRLYLSQEHQRKSEQSADRIRET
jgi:GxxExxY protein